MVGPHFSNKSDFECLLILGRKLLWKSFCISAGGFGTWQVSRWAGRAGSSKLSSNLAKKTIQQTPRFPVQMQCQLV